MKHDAIVEQGIPIHERVPIPDELIPADSRVEIDAKIHAGYCKLILLVLPRPLPFRSLKATKNLTRVMTVTTGKVMTKEELDSVKGRGWEDVLH